MVDPCITAALAIIGVLLWVAYLFAVRSPRAIPNIQHNQPQASLTDEELLRLASFYYRKWHNSEDTSGAILASSPSYQEACKEIITSILMEHQQILKERGEHAD